MRKPMTAEEYRQAVDDLLYRVPTLETYRRAMALDNNFVWHIQTGDLVNLLEEAIEEIDLLQDLLDASEAANG